MIQLLEKETQQKSSRLASAGLFKGWFDFRAL